MSERFKSSDDAARLRKFLVSLSLCLGFIVATCGDSIQGDGISYLDIGDNFFAGDWNAILNGLWSPLYPFLQGMTRWIFRPSMGWEPAVVNATNFLIYVSTVFAFDFFWNKLFLLYRLLVSERQYSIAFSERQFLAFGYALFLFIHLDLVTFVTPDMLLSTIIYFLAGLMVEIKLSGISLRGSCVLGILLGVGFLVKAVMLPLAPIFFTCAILPNFRRRHFALHLFVVLLAFGIVAGPYVFELSKKEGHLTVGEAGALNYAWHIDGAPIIHWQGEIEGTGKPMHPTREIFSSPLIYKFETMPQATYPPWYDPYYWNDGIKPRFKVTAQLQAFERSSAQLLRAFWSQNGLIACILVLLAIRREPRKTLLDFFRVWYVWLPAVGAIGLYSIVWVEHRYVAQFFVMFYGAVLTTIHLPERVEGRQIIRAVTIVAVLLLTTRTVIDLAKSCRDGRRATKIQMEIAEKLLVQGVPHGAKVALLDAGLGEEWQKLIRLSVVDEIPVEEKAIFWCSDDRKRKLIDDTLSETGAVVVISTDVPDWAQKIGWERVGSTSVYFHRLGLSDGFKDSVRPQE